jgi:hypothetical protein
MDRRSSRGRALAGLVLALAGPWAAAADATRPPQGWSGSYRGELSGVAVSLRLEQREARLEGLLQIPGGLPTQLRGQIEGATASGIASNDDGSARFEVQRVATGLALLLRQPDPQGGPEVRLPIDLLGPLAEGTAEAPVARADSRPHDGPRDARLLGRWRYSQSYTSGQFTAVSEEFIEFGADGHCAYGGGRVMAGDANTSGDSGRGSLSPCEWQAGQKQLQLREPGGAWRSAGRYDLDAERGVLLQYLPDGSRRLWYRQ